MFRHHRPPQQHDNKNKVYLYEKQKNLSCLAFGVHRIVVIISQRIFFSQIVLNSQNIVMCGIVP